MLAHEMVLQKKFRRLSRYLVYPVISIGLLVVAGWQFDVELLKRPLPHLVAMNPVTAVLFILLGISFLFFLSATDAKVIRFLGQVFTCIAFATVFLKLLGVFTSFDVAIDHTLFSLKIDKEATANISNRMAPNTAFCFLLLSLALLLLYFKSSGKKTTGSQVLSLIVILFAVLSILGYLFCVPSFYGVLEYIPMAIHTAVCFLLMALAILFCRPTQGVMQELTGAYPGSQTARLLIPAAILIPALLGYVCLLGHWSGLFSTEFGLAILILGIIIIFVSLIWYNSVLLNRKDAQKQEAKSLLENHIQQLKESEEKFQKAFQVSGGGITITRLSDSVYMEVNNAFVQMTGYAKEELIGHTSVELGLTVSIKRREEVLQQVREEGFARNFEISVRSKTGKILEVISSVETILLKGERYAINIIYDITDKKRAEEALKKSNELFYNLFEHNPSSIAISRISDAKMMNVNDSFLKLFDFSGKDAVVGKKVADLRIWSDPLERDEMMRQLKENNRVNNLEGQVQTSTGEIKWASSSIIPLDIDNEPCLMAVTADITQRKQAEQQLEAVNKELEAFSYSISHDLRAPLRAINGYAKMLEEDYETIFDAEGKRLLATIQFNAIKMSHLIDDLLSFSRLGRKDIQTTNLDMNELVEGVLIDINKTTNYKTNIKLGKLHAAKGDYGLINQVLVNLISNSIKYSSKKENPVVEITSEVKDGEVIYTVKDNGDGFDMRYVDKLFGVFQRLHTNSEFEGTGVGLAIVKRIVNKHGGRVWAEAEPGKGATFKFTLLV